MAERRMFSKAIISSDEFMDLPLESQALYFHLAMQADDDGMINNARRIIRMIGLGEKDLQVLIDAKFLIAFDSGIIAIRHWKVHNWIRGDRYKPTRYQNELAQLVQDSNKAYLSDISGDIPRDIPDDIPDDNQVTYQRYTKDRIGKDSIDKVRRGKDRIDTPSEAVCLSSPSSLEKDFLVFWDRYPRKHNKSETFTAFRDALNSGTEFSTIMEGLDRYLIYLQLEKTDSQYIKYPATWLRKKCWQDDYSMKREITTKDLEPFVDIRQFSPKGGLE